MAKRPLSDGRQDGWLALLATLAIQAVASMAVRTVPVVAPMLAHAMQAPTSLGGLYVAILFSGALLSSLAGQLLCASGLALLAGWQQADVIRQAPPGTAGMATSGVLGLTDLGVVLGPPTFGVISAASGNYRAGFAMLALPVALGLWGLLRGQRNNP